MRCSIFAGPPSQLTRCTGDAGHAGPCTMPSGIQVHDMAADCATLGDGYEECGEVPAVDATPGARPTAIIVGGQILGMRCKVEP